MINELHEKVFEVLEEHRKTHPEFIYLTRTAKNKEKLDAGLWFLGGEKYVWVSWIKRSFNMNHSPALRLLIKKNGSRYACIAENGYKKEVEPEVIEFYRQARETIGRDYGPMEQKGDTYFALELDQSNGLEALTKFLEKTKPKLDHLVNKMGLEKILLTKEAFNERLELIKTTKEQILANPPLQKSSTRYWLYAAGEKGNLFDEFYSLGIMALGWESLGDLNQYKSKEDIAKKLQDLEGVDSSKKNDATANFEFKEVISIGDIVISKKGRTELLGYGVVTSDYYFDKSRKSFKSCRKVDWKKKGNWKLSYSLPLKTLTDTTEYETEDPNFEWYYERLLNEMADSQGSVKFNKRAPELNTILFGPPGTGKTYSTISRSLKIVDPAFLESNHDERSRLIRRFKDLLFDPLTEKGQIAFTTFHQSMSYEDFIEGIKPLSPETGSNQIGYDLVPGIFKQLVKAASSVGTNFNEKMEWLKSECSEADNKPPIVINTGNTEFSISYRGGKTFRIKPKLSVNPESDYPASIDNIRKMYEGASRNEVYNPTYVNGILSYLYKNGLDKYKSTDQKTQKPFVLIIDEINRGNVSQIFGELITLIEKDKRIGARESLEVILPYSKETFGVPSNLYIIGTMNTADRSVEALDAALRRRFVFEEMIPRYDLIELTQEVFGYELWRILETINLRLDKLLDKDHKIGHSYFLFEEKVNPEIGLLHSLYNSIIPLLQEYFFGDYGKIGLVLGKGFITRTSSDEAVFSDFEYEGRELLMEKIIYTIVDYRKPTLEEWPYTFEASIHFLMDSKV